MIKVECKIDKYAIILSDNIYNLFIYLYLSDCLNLSDFDRRKC